MSIIGFEPKERLLERARNLVDRPATFLANAADGTRVLMRALRHADAELRLAIELLVTAFGDKAQLIEPLYAVLRDACETEDTRHDAAIQLSVIGERLAETRELVRRLIEGTESKDADLRLHTTCALGWAGNLEAVLPLLERMHDEDERVRQVAVFALTNLRDGRIMGALLDRLHGATRAQQRTILFNLWRFETRQKDAAEVYLRFVEHEDADLRFDALVLLGQVLPSIRNRWNRSSPARDRAGLRTASAISFRRRFLVAA